MYACLGSYWEKKELDLLETALFTETDVRKTCLNISSIRLLAKIFFKIKYEKQCRTFEDFYTFNIFVVNRSSALFNKFITLDAKINNFRAFYT